MTQALMDIGPRPSSTSPSTRSQRGGPEYGTFGDQFSSTFDNAMHDAASSQRPADRSHDDRSSDSVTQRATHRHDDANAHAKRSTDDADKPDHAHHSEDTHHSEGADKADDAGPGKSNDRPGHSGDHGSDHDAHGDADGSHHHDHNKTDQTDGTVLWSIVTGETQADSGKAAKTAGHTGKATGKASAQAVSLDATSVGAHAKAPASDKAGHSKTHAADAKNGAANAKSGAESAAATNGKHVRAASGATSEHPQGGHHGGKAGSSTAAAQDTSDRSQRAGARGAQTHPGMNDASSKQAQTQSGASSAAHAGSNGAKIASPQHQSTGTPGSGSAPGTAASAVGQHMSAAKTQANHATARASSQAGGTNTANATTSTTHTTTPTAVHVPNAPAPTPPPSAPPAPPPPPMPQPALAGSLARLRGAANGTYQLRVSVHPSELGGVNVSATLHNGTLTVMLTPDQAARQAIMQALPQLRAHLADQGFTGVDVGLGTPQQDGGQQPNEDDSSAQRGARTAPGPHAVTDEHGTDTSQPRRVMSALSAIDRWL